MKLTLAASILRVNHQIYEEAHAVMLRSCTFILVMFVGGAGASLKKVLREIYRSPRARSINGEITPLSSFKHYVATFTIRNPNTETTHDSTVDQLMLINIWSWQQLVAQLSYSSVGKEETPVRDLSFELVLKDSRDSKLLRSKTQRALLDAIKKYLWRFRAFGISGAQSGADETMLAATSDPWKTKQEMFDCFREWRELGEATLKSGQNPKLATDQLQEASALARLYSVAGYYRKFSNGHSTEVVSILTEIQKHTFLCSLSSIEAYMLLAAAWTPSQEFCNVHAVGAYQTACIALSTSTKINVGFRADENTVAHLLLQTGIALKLMNHLDKSEERLLEAAAMSSIHGDTVSKELEIVRAMRLDGSWETKQKHGSIPGERFVDPEDDSF
jgi:hypothetical protein